MGNGTKKSRIQGTQANLLLVDGTFDMATTTMMVDSQLLHNMTRHRLDATVCRQCELKADAGAFCMTNAVVVSSSHT